MSYIKVYYDNVYYMMEDAMNEMEGQYRAWFHDFKEMRDWLADCVYDESFHEIYRIMFDCWQDSTEYDICHNKRIRTEAALLYLEYHYPELKVDRIENCEIKLRCEGYQEIKFTEDEWKNLLARYYRMNELPIHMILNK